MPPPRSVSDRAARVERGDWQTPRVLAEASVARIAALLARAPSTIVEPTCGEGGFLVAAALAFPRADLHGFEVNAEYTRVAMRALRGRSARIVTADFFATPWEKVLAELRAPVLVLGNPPWVTNAQLGALGSSNLPAKVNEARLRGLDARTGKSNFDVSEWMMVRLLEALAGREGTLAMLCKSAVARRVALTIARRGLAVAPVGIWRIDAGKHWGASVAAVLFVAETRRAGSLAHWPVYASLDAATPESSLAVVDGVLVADAELFERTRHLEGNSDPEWRSGVKHDCARVMELTRAPRSAEWVNGLGERVDVEDVVVHPLLKSSDIANARAAPTRAMIITQRSLGEDTRALRREAPRAWKYLTRHRALLDARKSSIYEAQPPFAVFGVGCYSFAPWKVAVSGLYKRSIFTVVGPHEGRPVVLDDTCYFLAFDDEKSARRVAKALRSAAASEFLAARIFWDAKRPITKAILQTLDLRALERSLR